MGRDEKMGGGGASEEVRLAMSKSYGRRVVKRISFHM